MDRILTTHVGSLIRPQEQLGFLAAVEQGEPIDQAAYEETLRKAVEDVVRRQAEAGIDIVDDGEMGKASWITYLYERVSGLETRMVSFEDGRNVWPPSRDRLAFPEFYAEHDAEVARQMVNMVRLAGGQVPEQAAVADEAPAEGKIWVCTELVAQRIVRLAASSGATT
jgi:methionine synthase II (cobalamin-independent)